MPTQRERLDKLVKEIKESRPVALNDERVQEWSTHAGLFGKLPAEVIVIIFKQLLCVIPGATSGVELWQHREDSTCGVSGLVMSCNLFAWCLKTSGQNIRLEVAARRLLKSIPSDPTSTQPYFDHFLVEERSKLDLDVFKSAVCGKVTHCCDCDDCKAARQVFNTSVVPPARPLLESVLNGQQPKAKVVWPNHVSHKMAVSSAADSCVLKLQSIDHTTTLLKFKNEPPESLETYTDLNFKKKTEIHFTFSGPQRGRVDKVAISPCGRYTAITKQTRDDRGRTNGSLVVFDEDDNELGELWYRNLYLHTVWFRPVEAGPPNLCFLSYNVGQEDSTIFPTDFEHSFTWKSNGIYQLSLDGGFQKACEKSVAGISYQRILDFDDVSDLYALRPTTVMVDWPEDSPKWQKTAPRIFGRSAVINTSVAASGSCIAAIVLGRSIADSGQAYRCAQIVFYDCPLSPPVNFFETLEDEELDQVRMRNRHVRAISNHYAECLNMSWRLRKVNLSPCGDTAVVFQQARNGEFFVLVYMRLSPSSGFTVKQTIRLEHTIQDPSTETAYTLRTLPVANLFSPCGRYVLVAFGANDPVLQVFDSQSGVCIIDVCGDGDSEPETTFLPYDDDLVPEQMYWNGTGLWLINRRGALLLGL